MTVHKVRVKVANGSKIASKGTRKVPALVRIMGSFPAEDWKCLVWLAKKRGVPVANVLRDSVYAYVQCIRADVA